MFQQTVFKPVFFFILPFRAGIHKKKPTGDGMMFRKQLFEYLGNYSITFLPKGIIVPTVFGLHRNSCSTRLRKLTTLTAPNGPFSDQCEKNAVLFHTVVSIGSSRLRTRND